VNKVTVAVRLSVCVCVSVSGWEAVVRGSPSGAPVGAVWASTAVPVVDDDVLCPRQGRLTTQCQPATPHSGHSAQL